MTLSRGIVFATTTPYYTTMARKAARNLRAIDPDLDIDLFTDQDIIDPVFARIERLQVVNTRPKIEATWRSRFDLTLTLDSDIIAVAPFREVFDVIKRFDLSLALANTRTKFMGLDDPDIPRAFPLYNSGVMGVRKTAATQAFLQQWAREFHADPIKADQRSLRRLLWASDLTLCPLPVEYNTTRLVHLLRSGPHHGAPRLLHLMQLDKTPLSDPDSPFCIEDVIDPDVARHLQWLLRTDYALGGDPSLPRPVPERRAMRNYLLRSGT